MFKFYYNGCDTVIAESVEDANSILRKMIGDDIESLDEFEELGKYGSDEINFLWTDEKVQDSFVPAGAKVEPNAWGYLITATADQWIAHLGRCYFGSNEW